MWELEQRRLITETLQEYCEQVDRNDPARLVELVFCEDASFELGARHAVVGHENLSRMFAKTLAGFSRTSHHLSNVKISFESDRSATSSAYVYAWHTTLAGDRVEAWGRYHDRLRLTEAGWRIENRHISMAGHQGWGALEFEMIERLPSAATLPSPEVLRR